MNKDYRELFSGTAPYYTKYRPGYQQEVFEYLVSLFKLDGSGILLDLGCGTGQVTFPLSPYFAKVIGVDPDPEMLKEAEREARQRGLNNIIWNQSTAEDLELSEKLRLTTMGISFHWMEQEAVLEKLYSLTLPGGGIAILGDTSPVWEEGGMPAWKIRRREIIKKFLGEERKAGHGTYQKPKRTYGEVLKESKFSDITEKQFSYTLERSIEEIIGHLFSTSYANKRLLGERAVQFEKEMREELLAVEPSGIFIEEGSTDVISARK